MTREKRASGPQPPFQGTRRRVTGPAAGPRRRRASPWPSFPQRPIGAPPSTARRAPPPLLPALRHGPGGQEELQPLHRPQRPRRHVPDQGADPRARAIEPDGETSPPRGHAPPPREWRHGTSGFLCATRLFRAGLSALNWFRVDRLLVPEVRSRCQVHGERGGSSPPSSSRSAYDVTSDTCKMGPAGMVRLSGVHQASPIQVRSWDPPWRETTSSTCSLTTSPRAQSCAHRNKYAPTQN